MAINKNKINDNALKFIQKGQIKKAIREYEKILAEEPGDVRTLLKKGDLLVRIGDRDQAVETYLKVANAYSQQGFHLKAVAVFKQILKLDDSRIDVNLRLAEEYQNLGIIGDAMNHLQIVAAYYDQQQMTRESLDILRRIVDLDPENIASRIKLAELYSRQEMLAEAVEEFRKAAEDLKNANRVEDYIKVAERLIYHDPSDIQLIKELANIYLQRGDTKRALGKLQICFKSDSRDIETLSLLSMAFQELGQLSKTVSVLKEMAKIYEEQGSISEMQDVYRRILEIAPDDEEARAAFAGAVDSSAMDDISMDFDEQVIEMAPEQDADETVIESEIMPEVADQMTVEATMPRQNVVVEEQVAAPDAAPAYSGTLSEEVLDHISRLLTETEVYIKYGLNTKAYEHLNKVFEVDPNNIEAHTKLKDLYLSAGQQNHACQELATLVHISTRVGRQELAKGFMEELLTLDPEYPDAAMFQEMVAHGDLSSDDEDAGESLDFDVDMESSVDVPIDMDPESFDQLTVPEYGSAGQLPDSESVLMDSGSSVESPDDFSMDLDPNDAMEPPDFLDESPVAIDSGPEEEDLDEAATYVAQEEDFDQVASADELEPPVLDFDDESSMDDYGQDEETIDVGRMVTGQYDPDSQPEEILAVPTSNAGDVQQFEPEPEPSDNPIIEQPEPILESGSEQEIVDADDLIIMDDEPSIVSPIGDVSQVEQSQVELSATDGSDVILLDDGSGEWDVSEDLSSARDLSEPDGAIVQDGAMEIIGSNDEALVEPLGQNPGPGARPRGLEQEDFGDEEKPTQLHMAPLDVPEQALQNKAVESYTAGDLTDDDSDFDDGIEEVEFFIQQNLLDEASDALGVLQENYADRPQVLELAEKLKGLKQGEQPPAQVTPEDLGEEFDLAAEIEREVATGSIDDEFQYSVDDVFSEFKKGVARVVEKEDSATHFDLGIAYREMGLMDDAIGEFQVASQDLKRRCESLSMIGMCYLDKGQYSEAINTFKDALHVPGITDQQALGIYYEMGNVYDLLKDKNESLFYFKKVYKRDPKFRDITSRLKKIIKAAGKSAKRPQSELEKTNKKSDGKNKISYM